MLTLAVHPHYILDFPNLNYWAEFAWTTYQQGNPVCSVGIQVGHAPYRKLRNLLAVRNYLKLPKDVFNSQGQFSLLGSWEIDVETRHENP